MIALLHPLHDEAIDETSGEADAHPHTGLGLGVEGLRHRVVEKAIEVGQGHIDRHARHPVRHGTIVPGGCDIR